MVVALGDACGHPPKAGHNLKPDAVQAGGTGKPAAYHQAWPPCGETNAAGTFAAKEICYFAVDSRGRSPEQRPHAGTRAGSEPTRQSQRARSTRRHKAFVG